MTRRWLPLLVLFAGLAACGEPSEPAPVDAALVNVIAETDRPLPGQHVRYCKPDAHGGGLDVAVTRFTHPDGKPDVLLVGVVHIADPGYFEQVQDALDEVDMVLYEGVIPEDRTGDRFPFAIDEPERGVRAFQARLAGWFGFAFQLDAIDYDRPHFVHADLTAEEFAAAGGDDLGFVRPGADDDAPDGDVEDGAGDGLAFGAGDDWSALPSELQGIMGVIEKFGALADRMMAKPSPLRSWARRAFAEAMGSTDLESSLDMFPEISELLIDRRNAVVIEKLKEQLGNAEGTIAIFYGAAHNRDLEQSLQDELGYRRASGRWLRAWALNPPLR